MGERPGTAGERREPAWSPPPSAGDQGRGRARPGCAAAARIRLEQEREDTHIVRGEGARCVGDALASRGAARSNNRALQITPGPSPRARDPRFDCAFRPLPDTVYVDSWPWPGRGSRSAGSGRGKAVVRSSFPPRRLPRLETPGRRRPRSPSRDLDLHRSHSPCGAPSPGRARRAMKGIHELALSLGARSTVFPRRARAARAITGPSRSTRRRSSSTAPIPRRTATAQFLPG